jgi:hypothetical protein
VSLLALNESQLAGEILARWEEAQSHHQYFVNLYERRERSYRGVKARAQRGRWQHDLRPPYGFNLLETVVASQIDMGLTYRAKPSPHARMTAEEAQTKLAVVKDIEHLIRHEYRVDDMDQKQRPVFLCDGIGGRGILKTYWNYVPGVRKRQAVQNVEHHDDAGNYLGTMPQLVEIEESGVLLDHSTTEVVDPRDFVTHESARDIDPRKPGGAQYVFHRCWYSFEQLKWLEKMGYVSGVDALKESRSVAQDYNDRETEVFNVDRSKDLIEVLEYWHFEDGKIWSAWLGGKTKLLKPLSESPVLAPAVPLRHRLVDAPAVLAQGHEHHRVDRGLAGDPLGTPEPAPRQRGTHQQRDHADSLRRGRPRRLRALPWRAVGSGRHLAGRAADPAVSGRRGVLAGRGALKGDLQNVTSAAPFAGGAQTATMDQKTATGASIVMNAAQQQLAQKKYQAQFGLKREANLRLKNCQQFYGDDGPDDSVLVHIIGPDGAIAFKQIPVLAMQGDFVLELEPMGESEMRQEKRAEASNFGQMMMGWAPLAAAAGKPLDVEQIIRWVAERWDIEFPDQFFSQAPAAGGAMAALSGPSGSGGPSGGPGAAAPPGGGPNLGVTADTAVDASSPSATGGMSMSPQMFLQRALAMGRGGGGGGSA